MIDFKLKLLSERGELSKAGLMGGSVAVGDDENFIDVSGGVLIIGSSLNLVINRRFFFCISILNQSSSTVLLFILKYSLAKLCIPLSY